MTYKRSINHPTYGHLLFEVTDSGCNEWNVYIQRFGIGVFDGTIRTKRPVGYADVCEIAIDVANKQGKM